MNPNSNPNNPPKSAFEMASDPSLRKEEHSQRDTDRLPGLTVHLVEALWKRYGANHPSSVSSIPKDTEGLVRMAFDAGRMAVVRDLEQELRIRNEE